MDRKNCVCSDDDERCMMGQCKECTGQNGLVDFLKQCDELIDVEEVTFTVGEYGPDTIGHHHRIQGRFHRKLEYSSVQIDPP